MSTKSTPLDPATLRDLVLGGAVPNARQKKAKASLPNGTDLWFDRQYRIRGRLQKGQPYDAAPGSALGDRTVVAKVLRELGADADAIKKATRKALNEAVLGKGRITAEQAAHEKAIDAALGEVDAAVVAQMPRQPRAASVKVDASVEEVKGHR